MGNFRSNERKGFGRDRPRSGGFDGGRGFGGNRGGFGGRRGGFRDREEGFNARDRPRHFVKHELTCDKCGKLTDVPFEPTTGKPIYCRECFDAGAKGGRFSSSSSSGMTQEQFNVLNSKVDKILEFLENIELVEDEEEFE